MCICTDNSSLSFPSGHSCRAASLMTYTCLMSLHDLFFLRQSPTWNSSPLRPPQLTLTSVKKTLGTFCLTNMAFIPVVLALWIGATRISDYWHFVPDVLGKYLSACPTTKEAPTTLSNYAACVVAMTDVCVCVCRGSDHRSGGSNHELLHVFPPLETRAQSCVRRLLERGG